MADFPIRLTTASVPHIHIVAVCAAKAAMQGKGKRWVIIEPRSSTMRSRIHQHTLATCFAAADHVLCLVPVNRGEHDAPLLDVYRLCHDIGHKAVVVNDYAMLADAFAKKIKLGDDLMILSNGSVTALHEILDKVRAKI